MTLLSDGPESRIVSALAPEARWPFFVPLHSRNTALDTVFYNVGDLTQTEITALTRATTREGRVLIVHPSGRKGECGVAAFPDHATVRANPGPMLDQFCIAGVGSSDLGAAALARDVANATRAPVGAIVAGYGLLDAVMEGLGGWAYLGVRNRFLATLDSTRRGRMGRARDTAGPTTSGTPAWATPDAETLRRFFLDDDRDIRLVVGHSKGCLSIAEAMARLENAPLPAVHDRMRRVRVVTTGAVVRFPAVCANVAQYLGELDVLGACNSRGAVPRVLVPDANHHLNPWLPYHLSMAKVLKHAETGGALWPSRPA